MVQLLSNLSLCQYPFHPQLPLVEVLNKVWDKYFIQHDTGYLEFLTPLIVGCVVKEARNWLLDNNSQKLTDVTNGLVKLLKEVVKDSNIQPIILHLLFLENINHIRAI